jgi:isopentenyldiphosphate isomerase
MALPDMVDCIDADGVPTGQSKPRTSVHQDGDWHRTVHVWIVNSLGEVLFQKRSMLKESFPGMWDVSSAGHIESNETSIAAAERELHEEIGVIVVPQDLRFLFSLKNTSNQHEGTFIDNEISDVYLVCRDIDVQDIPLQTSEVSEVKFLPVSKLRRLADCRDLAFAPHYEEYGRLFDYISGAKK